MTLPIEYDRLAQLLMAQDHGLFADEARSRLESAQIIVTTDEPDAIWAQAALLAIAALGVRMLRGGVYISGIGATPLRIGAAVGTGIRRAMVNLGCRDTGLPLDALRLHVGSRPPSRVDLHVMADGWRAIVSPQLIERGEGGHAVSGTLAGAMAVSELFRKAVLGDLLACRRPIQLSAWDPAFPMAGQPISHLPVGLWQLGLGNLGQATLFLLSLLPFPDRGEIDLTLQDRDTAGEENRATQILTEPAWIGVKKARAAAAYADRLGFRTVVDEQSFHARSWPAPIAPRIALVGVDNLETRRFAAEERFALVLDAGLGRTAEEIFDVRLLGFPGRRKVEDAWPDHGEEGEDVELNPGLAMLVKEGRLSRCGAMSIAGQSLGVPSTALVAACLQVGQLCRALATGQIADFIDLTLINPDRVVATTSQLPPDVSLPSCRAA